MKKILLFTFSLISISINAQQWSWAKSSTNGGHGNAICSDANGNVFVTGSFGSSIAFGNIVLTNSGTSNVFIVKYDANGNIVWATNIGGSLGSSIDVDPSGNIFVTGWFTNPSIVIGTTTLTNAGGLNPGGQPASDMFIAKLNASGNVLWAKRAGGINGDEFSRSLSTDANGNVFVTGTFDGVYTAFESDTLTTLAMFLVKYDTNGNLLWARDPGASNGESVSTDAAGNVFVTGAFSSTVSFDTIVLTSLSLDDVFLTKYNANGNVIWAKNTGGQGRAQGYSVSADAFGNVFVGGWFNGTNIIFGSDTLIGDNNGSDPFIAKYNSNGVPVWARTATEQNSCNDYCQSLSATPNGDVYVAGYFETFCSSVTFGTFQLNYIPSNCMPNCSPGFFVKYDANGNVISAVALADGGDGVSLSADPNGNASICGTFSANPLVIGTHSLTPVGGQNVFVAKYQPGNSNGIKDASSSFNMTLDIFPNPSSGIFTVDLHNCKEAKLCVHDVLGNCLFEKNCQGEISHQIDLKDQPRGIYFIELLSGGERVVKKLAVQ